MSADYSQAKLRFIVEQSDFEMKFVMTVLILLVAIPVIIVAIPISLGWVIIRPIVKFFRKVPEDYSI